MRARNLKPGFFDNEELAELGPYAQLLFEGLWCLADREGKLQDRPKRIKAKIFPYYEPEPSVDTLLDRLAEKLFILRYEAEGAKCIWVVNFLKHERPHDNEADSVLPDPPAELLTKLQLTFTQNPKGLRSYTSQGRKGLTPTSNHGRKDLPSNSPHGEKSLPPKSQGLRPESLNPESLNPESLNPEGVGGRGKSSAAKPDDGGATAPPVDGAAVNDSDPIVPLDDPEQGKTGKSPRSGLPFTPNNLAQAWNEYAPGGLPRVMLPLKKSRADKIRGAIRDHPDLGWWISLFTSPRISERDFLMGRKSNWKANFDFVTRRWDAILEGQYDNAGNGGGGPAKPGNIHARGPDYFADLPAIGSIPNPP